MPVMKQDPALEITPVVHNAAALAPSIQPMTVEDPEEPNAVPSRSTFRIAAIMTSLYLSLFVAALDQTIVSTAIPTITSELRSAAGYTWIGGAYLVAKVAVMPIWSKLSDIWGRKPMLLANLFLFAGSSVLCATAQSMAMLIAGRALQGVGGGGLMQLVYVTIADLFSLRRRNLFIGCTEFIWAAAAGVGPVLGGALAQRASWRWMFWLNLPAAGLAFGLAAVWLDVHDPGTGLREGLAAVDWVGAVAMVGLAVMLLLGLTLGGEDPAAWSSAKVVCLLVFGAAMLAAFVVSERRFAAHPIVPLRILRDRGIVAALLTGAFHAFVSLAAEYYLPLYFQAAQLATPVRSGVLILPLMLTEAASAAAGGFAIHRTGEYRRMLQAGMAVGAAGIASWCAFGADTGLGTVIGLQVLAGVGIGLGFETPIIAIQAAVPQADVAAATATSGLLRNLSNALSIVVGGVVFQHGVAKGKAGLLAAGMDEKMAARLAGPDAAAYVEEVRRIPDVGQQWAARRAFAGGMRDMWIVYACAAGAGVVASMGIKRSLLTDGHTETKTGIPKKEKPAVNVTAA